MTLKEYFDNEYNLACINMAKAETTLDIIEDIINSMGFDIEERVAVNRHYNKIVTNLNSAKYILDGYKK